MSDLIEKEYKLAVDRIADLRNRRLADLPDRFGLVNEAFVEDTVALLLNRVERGARKISNGSGDVASKVEAGNRLVDQQLTRFDEAAQDTKSQIAAFYEELLQQETQAIDTSSAEVRRFAVAAKEAYDAIMRDAKFAVTMDEWQGWDVGVRKRATLFAEELAAVQRGTKRVSTASGAVDLSKEAPDVQKEINALRAWTDKLHGAARRELVAYGDSALAQLAGGGVVAKISDVTDRLAEQASRISTDAAAGMVGAVGAARAKLGLGEPAADGYVARAKAYVAAGKGSGSSFDDYVSSLSAGAGAVASSASSLASQASSSVASAVGTPSPASAYEAASSAVVGAANGAASNARAAASSASGAVGGAVSQASVAASRASRSRGGCASRSETTLTPSPRVGEWCGGGLVDIVVVKASRSVLPPPVRPRPSRWRTTSSARDHVVAAGKAAQRRRLCRARRRWRMRRVECRRGVRRHSPRAHVVASGGKVAAAAQGGVSSAASWRMRRRRVQAWCMRRHRHSSSAAASRSAASAVGASPSPETLQDRVDDARDGVNSVVDAASSSAGVVYASAASAAQAGVSSASSLASAASRSAASAVGASPTPETLADYIDDASDAAGKMAKKAHGAVSKAAAQVHVEL